MPTARQAYYTIRERLRAFLGGASKPQLTNLSLLVFGLFAAGNSQLPRIAAKLPLPSGAASLTQRLRRLLMNEAVKPTELYRPVARFLLSCFAGGSARLILDATDLGGRLPILFAALAYRGRALPLAWRMLPAMGCSAFSEQKALLSQVAALAPPGVAVTLLADREYGSAAMARFCLAQGWHFCLRLKKSRWLLLDDGSKRKIGSLPLSPGGRLFLSGVRLPALPGRSLNLACGWSRDNKDDQPWFILSDLPADHRALSTYAARFHIEEMFRDFKEFGFRLETTHLRDRERVSRLLLCVCLAHVWLMNAGVWVGKRGLRRRVDRHKKRQLSYFQIGWRYLQRQWACGLPLRCELHAYT
jgi:DDE family transposase